MTQPAPLDDTIEDGQSDHAGIHSEERARINVAVAKAWEALTKAQEALTLAGAKSTKPVGGWPLSDIVTDGLTITVRWNGTDWVTPAGTVVTAGNRPANTQRVFIGGPDANAAGLMIDGDVQKAPAT